MQVLLVHDLGIDRQSGALGFGPPLFIMRNIRSFADAITTYYRQRGYLDVIVEPEVSRDEERNTATISMRVTEGDQYRFGSVVLAASLLGKPGAEPRQQGQGAGMAMVPHQIDPPAATAVNTTWVPPKPNTVFLAVKSTGSENS